ncbi:hypothetical protein PsAD2_03312 [Pseudovibrio axinellae]|uniref:Uncharacterized protein n=1 Tax=Pseudovibrio axinellae TaxID=989403 RepID=A0A165WSF1_9HYPH|nr:hypothetical protein PsAD2_03312 [Pseudovibrio axinellae]SER67312.1 hypothetical protein SAMN05421798_1165 [Pseudovibrio axinellae]
MRHRMRLLKQQAREAEALELSDDSPGTIIERQREQAL